ncbi:MAG: Asp23/Gls24 family envelope stress response protein [Clostridia bacterium]|nr:Asp23/Gls24 family envelope stress response protein [Clostridia bacterium]MBR2371646.1 Asp23/Gls24 family envelope stress response protein [Clostridia bacterium]
MALRTSNGYGAITVSDEVVATIVGKLALECYGVVDKVPQKFADSVADLFRKKNDGRGVRVTTKNGRINIDVFVILKFGLSIEAVSESLRSTIKYGVENFTGMVVNTVNVHVVGIRI